jgi:CxxH/CxxC protein (TIGR04129 family)
MYCVCAEHLDQAIDEFVEVYEMPPDIYRLSQVSFTDWEAPAMCNFCSRPPQFLVV